MKKLLTIVFAYLFLNTIAWANQSPTASQVSTNCSTWSKNLNCTMTTQQLVDNALDQLNGGGTSGVNWGSIGGILGNQTDLQTVLNTKQGTITTGTTAQYLRGDLSLATFPTNLNQFTNGPGYITDNQTITLSGPVTGSGATSIATTLAALGIQSSNINWSNINGLGPINKGGINWTNFPASGFAKWNGQSAPTADTNTYLTGNQSITLSGDTTGSGTTAISTTLKNTGTAGTYRSVTFDAQGRETSGTNPTTFSGYGVSDSSANLRSALTDSTGTGVAVFGTAPNLTANVGIGSANPGQALDVKGNLRTSGTLTTAAWEDPINEYNCAGVSTTTTGTISSGTNSLVVASASGWSVGMGIAVANAGTGGNTELISYITAINGTTFTLNDNAVTTATTQTVNHDDTRCLNSAVQAADGRGVHLRGGLIANGVGVYNVTSKITLTQTINIVGDGALDRRQKTTYVQTVFGSEIQNRGTSNDIIDGTGVNTIGFGMFRDFSIQQASGITHTAGYAIRLGNGNGAQKVIHDITIEHISTSDVFGGISFEGHIYNSWVHNNDIRVLGGSGSIGFNYSQPTGGGGDRIGSNTFFVQVTTSGKAVSITSSDTNIWDHDNFNGGANNLYIADDVGNINHLNFVACSFENGDGTDPLIEIKSTGAAGSVDDIAFTGGELGANGSGPGIEIDNHANGISITGMLFITTTGVILNSNGGNYNIANNIFDGATSGAVWLESASTSNVIMSGNSYVSSSIPVKDTTGGFTSIIHSRTYNGNANIGIGTSLPRNNLEVNGTSDFVNNVGINSVSPGQKLDVQGTIRATNLTDTSINGLTQCIHADTNGNFTGTGSDCGAGGGGSGTVNSGTAGQASYYASSTSAVSGTSDLIYSGSNVGINSVTPGQILDVQGTVRATAFQIGSNTALSAVSGTTGTIATTSGSLTNTHYAKFDGSGNVIDGGTGTGSTLAGGGANAVQYTNAASAFLGSEANFSFNGTNVGIGTTNATSASLSIVKNGSNKLFATNSTAGAGGDYFLVDNSGNVGVNSTAPGQILDVQGTARATQFIDTGLTASTPIISNSSKQLASGTYSGNTTTIATSSGSLTNGDCVKLDANGNYVDSGSACGGGSSQWATQNTTDVSLAGGNVGVGTTITSNAALTVMNGNVGIGTWKPAALLDISKLFQINNSGAIQRIANTAVTIDNTAFKVNNSGVTISNESNSSGSDLVMYGGKNANSFLLLKPSGVTTNGGYLDFQSGNVGLGTFSALHIYDGGNVGIGTMGTGNLGIGTTAMGASLVIGGAGNKIRFEDANGVSWTCGPAITTGAFTCTSP